MSDPWPVLDSDVEYDPGWFAAGYDRVRRPDESVADYFWVDPGQDAVTVVARADDRLVMVEQYRPKLGRSFLECPAGKLEDGESFETAAERELREETGYRADSTRQVQAYHPTALCRYERGIVVADGLEAGDPDHDEGEFVEVHHVPVEAAFEIARRRGATGWTLTPLLAARADGFL